MELGEPDASGRRRPIPVKDSNFTITCDMFIVAIGQEANRVLLDNFTELELNKWGGYIKADPETGATSVEGGVYAGGDIVTGAATVIEAMGGAGKKAAKAIDEYISSRIKERKS